MRTTRSTSVISFSMMPFAFDLISTFVIGSILPVATTDFVMVPRSMVAILEESSSDAAPSSVV